MMNNRISGLRAVIPPTTNEADDLQDEEERDLQVDDDFWKAYAYVYKSPCTVEVSHSQLTPQQIEAMYFCYREFYAGCIGNSSDFNRTGLFQLDLEFDYELHYGIGANLTLTIGYLERAIAERLASMTGLLLCNSNLPHNTSFFTNAQLDRLKAIWSKPVDKPDPTWCKCLQKRELTRNAALYRSLTRPLRRFHFLCHQ